jgi:4-diphosphocytidyl-2-C-methyl-D-erythritol kinase
VTIYESPAKLNLALLVAPPRSDGYHPIESLVQTIEWLDLVEVEEAEDESVVIDGADIDPEDNLVVRALDAIRGRGNVPRLAIRVEKQIPSGAGLGGGSSNAAATLLAATETGGLPAAAPGEVAPSLGADVPLFLTGGSLIVTGIGEVIEPLQPPLSGFAVAVAVPPLEMSTVEVYRRWDLMEGPMGETIEPSDLPPGLRDGIPIRNDLTPAAIAIEPTLADFMADLRSHWGGPVMMTGSGSGCFSFFPDVGEATDAATSVSLMCRAVAGAGLRPNGVSRRPRPNVMHDVTYS